MKIEKNAGTITVHVSGKLDTVSSPEVEKDLEGLYDGVNEVIVDLSDAIYVSSAGLRVILGIERRMERCGGNLRIRNASDMVKEVFTETGLTDILTLE